MAFGCAERVGAGSLAREAVHHRRCVSPELAMPSTTLLARIVLATAGPAVGQTAPVVLRSPSRELEIAFATLADGAPAETGQLAYHVTFRAKPVLDWSNLGLDLQGAQLLGREVRILASDASSGDETWSAPHGKANPIRNRYNAVTVRAAETSRPTRRLEIEARAYDDGLAFRYFVPDQPVLSELRLTAEATQ